MAASSVSRATPIHIIFMLDNSASMAGSAINDLNNAMADAIANFQCIAQGKDYFKLSVVAFGSQDHVLFEHVSEADIGFDSIKLNGNGGTTNMAAALTTAKMLEEKYPTKSSDCVSYGVMITDGVPDDVRFALESAESFKTLPSAAGSPKLVVLTVGENANQDIAKQIASTELHLHLPTSTELLNILPQFGTLIAANTEINKIEDILEV